MANDLAEFYVPKSGFDKTIVHRYIAIQYQLSLMMAEELGDKQLRKAICDNIDWKSYRIVSRTKPRHRLNYWKNRLKYMFLR